MCQLCQHRKPGEASVLQEVFHEMGMETSTAQSGSQPNMPFYRLPWRERRAQRASNNGSARETSLLNEVLQSL